MKSTNITVGTTAVIAVSADNKYRQVYVHNAGGGKVYVGGSNVSTTNGFHIANAEAATFEVPINETLYAISASGTNELIVLTPDGD